MYTVESERDSITQCSSHGSLVPSPWWWVHGQSFSQSIVWWNCFRTASGYRVIRSSAPCARFFHSGSAYARNHWLSTIFTIARAVHRHTTSPDGSQRTSACPFARSCFFTSSFAISTRIPENGPVFSLITPA